MIVLKIIGWMLLSLLAVILIVLCIRIRIGVEYSDDNTHVVLEWLFLKIPLYPMSKKEPKEKEKKQASVKAEQPEQCERVSENADGVSEKKPEEASEKENDEDIVSDEAAEEEKKPEKKKESLLHIIYRTHGIDGIMQILRRVFSYIGTFIGDLMRALVIEELYLDIGCTRSDAAQTALYYGEVCSSLYPMLGALASKCKIKKYDINVYPDYLARFGKANFYVKFHLYPIYVCAISVALVFKLIFKVLLGFLVKIFLPKKENKAEKQNIKKEKRDESNEGSVSSRNTVNNDRESSSAC